MDGRIFGIGSCANGTRVLELFMLSGVEVLGLHNVDVYQVYTLKGLELSCHPSAISESRPKIKNGKNSNTLVRKVENKDQGVRGISTGERYPV